MKYPDGRGGEEAGGIAARLPGETPISAAAVSMAMGDATLLLLSEALSFRRSSSVSRSSSESRLQRSVSHRRRRTCRVGHGTTHFRLCSLLKGSEMTHFAWTLRHREHG